MDPIIFSLGLSSTRAGERIRADRELELQRAVRERRSLENPAADSGRSLSAIARFRIA